MNKKRNIDKIKNLEGSPKVIKNLFSYKAHYKKTIWDHFQWGNLFGTNL